MEPKITKVARDELAVSVRSGTTAGCLMVPIEMSQWGRAGCTNGAY